MAFLVGLSKEILLILFVLLIHEMGHLTFIALFRNTISKITLYPFGGVILYENKNDYIYKSFLITIGGLLFNFIFYFIFYFLNLNLLADINFYFILVNLLPIYPLDGGKVFIILLSLFIPYRLSIICCYILSILFSLLLGIHLFINFSGFYILFFILFFFKINFSSLFFINKEYHSFLLIKFLYPNLKLKDRITVFFTFNPINSLFYGRNTIFDFKTFKVKDDIVIKKYFKK